MPVIALELWVNAPPQVCFDLTRSVDLHVTSTAQTGEKAVAGVTTGLMALGDVVTWEARHFGMVQHHTSRITRFEPPHHFQDTMVKGTFQRVVHDHYFEEDNQGTRMVSRFDYTSPLGPLGQAADALFLKAYLRRFLETRLRMIKQVAESGDWRRYVKSS